MQRSLIWQTPTYTTTLYEAEEGDNTKPKIDQLKPFKKMEKYQMVLLIFVNCILLITA